MKAIIIHTVFHPTVKKAAIFIKNITLLISIYHRPNHQHSLQKQALRQIG